MGRTFVTSDTHGDYEGLMKCLGDANFNCEEDKLIHCGDIVDRGPDSKKIVEFLLTVENRVCVQGNHDEWWKTFIHTGGHPGGFRHGAFATLESYQKRVGSMTEEGEFVEQTVISIPGEHRELFDTMVDYHIDDKNRLFIHAGYDRNYLLEKQHPSIFRWDRDMNYQVMAWKKEERMMDVNNFDRVFYGHCATVMMGDRKADPIYKAQFVAIDTGAGYPQIGGRVTVLDITDDTAHKIYYSR